MTHFGSFCSYVKILSQPLVSRRSPHHTPNVKLSAAQSACTEDTTGWLLKMPGAQICLTKNSATAACTCWNTKNHPKYSVTHVCAFAQTNQKYHKTLQRTRILIKAKKTATHLHIFGWKHLLPLLCGISAKTLTVNLSNKCTLFFSLRWRFSLFLWTVVNSGSFFFFFFKCCLLKRCEKRSLTLHFICLSSKQPLKVPFLYINI